VPACRSLDCISVFTHTLADAALVDQVVAGFDAEDPWSRPMTDVGQADVARAGQRVGVPLPHQRQFAGDDESARLYEQALAAIAATGAELVPLDIALLSEAASLLYDGPWVAERTAALAGPLAQYPDRMDPCVRAIAAAGQGVEATALFNGQYRLAELARAAEALWRQADLLALPTAPTCPSLADMRADPIRRNAELGLYTNFVNLLDMSALALPAGWRANRTGFGITLIGPAHADRALLAAAHRFAPALATPAPAPDHGEPVETIRLAVVGAHLQGMPLHGQLTARGARFVAKTTTAPFYRLYAMAGTTPPKPALFHDADGAALEVEVYELGLAAFGSFVAEVPAPLAIGTVELADGTQVKGFVAEPRALAGAVEITHLGGWRAYIASRG